MHVLLEVSAVYYEAGVLVALDQGVSYLPLLLQFGSLIFAALAQLQLKVDRH